MQAAHKTIVVTGGSTGIGAAICRAFLDAGHEVVNLAQRPLELDHARLRNMQARQFGRIILITSRAALGLQTRTSYSATKSGMMGMARTWALELGEYGITVNTVAPGPISATEMFHEVIPEDKLDSMARSIPVRRLGLPADVARAVSFFNDPDNGFVTGQTLMVCGGASLGSLSL